MLKFGEIYIKNHRINLIKQANKINDIDIDRIVESDKYLINSFLVKFRFCIPWKYLEFSGDIKWERWSKMP